MRPTWASTAAVAAWSALPKDRNCRSGTFRSTPLCAAMEYEITAGYALLRICLWHCAWIGSPSANAGARTLTSRDVPGQIERDAAGHDGWVLTDSGTVAGFAIASRRPPGGAEILWIAVDPARRGQRLGTVLLDHVLDELAAAGVSVVEAKTLDRSAGYPPYEATQAFWEHKGFVHIDTIDPLPGWQPGNPAAIYVAALRPTR